MSKEENVIKYYVMCNKLKNVIRTGWKTWNVERERVESVAEHIFGVQMLAIAMKSEYEYDIDIMKVIFMLAVHELGEIVIGNKTLENELVKKLLSEEKTWSGMWLRFGQTVYPYDDNFKDVSKYALNNSISKKGLNK